MLSSFSHVHLFATPWTVPSQASLSMGFSRQEYWNGLPCPSFSRGSSSPGIKPESRASSAFQMASLPLSHQGSPQPYVYSCLIRVFEKLYRTQGQEKQQYNLCFSQAVHCQFSPYTQMYTTTLLHIVLNNTRFV